MLHVSLHVFRNILAANFRIRYEDDSESIDTMCITLGSAYLQVSLLWKGNLKSTFDFSAPEGFFIPTSVSGVSAETSYKILETSEAKFVNDVPSIRTHGERVFDSSFRFQIPNSDVLKLIESKINEDIEYLNILIDNDNSQRFQIHMPQGIKEIFRLLIKPQTMYEMHCAGCNVPLGKAIFSDIKDHCAESFSEGWFCHQSDELRINDRLSLECLYADESSFLISDGILKQKLCRCGSVLFVEGPDPRGFVRVCFDKIFFRDSLSLSAYQKYQKWIIIRTLCSLIEKSRTPALFTKIILQSKPNNLKEDTCLLLMIPKEKVACFHKRTSVLPCTTSIKTEPAYHILYQVGTHASKDVKTWRHAFDVDFYRVSDAMMDILIGYLKDSLFEDDPVETGFTYGYLPAC